MAYLQKDRHRTQLERDSSGVSIRHTYKKIDTGYNWRETVPVCQHGSFWHTCTYDIRYIRHNAPIIGFPQTGDGEDTLGIRLPIISQPLGI